jgi:hypothetical protein
MADELTDIITEALTELENPTVDTPEEPELAEEPSEPELVEEPTEDEPEEESEVEDQEAEVDADDEDSESEGEGEDETFEVKVDGETVEVTLKEALAGYQRQADYTRKLQALSEEKKQFEVEMEQYSGVLEQVEALDTAWEEDPVGVLSHFMLNTENPTHALALTIKDLAAQGALETQFLEMFGITPEVRQSWAQEVETKQLRKKAEKAETASEARARELEQEAAVQAAVAEFDRQIDEILDAEGMDMTVSQRKTFRSDLAKYARDNDITNLKAAYKAMRYEESKAKQAMAVKTVERAKAKKAATAVARTGSPAGTPVDSDNTDLRSVIMTAMKEQGV